MHMSVSFVYMYVSVCICVHICLHMCTYVVVYACTCMCAVCIGVWVHVGLCRSQRHKIAFEAGVPGGCEPTDVCAEN